MVPLNCTLELDFTGVVKGMGVRERGAGGRCVIEVTGGRGRLRLPRTV